MHQSTRLIDSNLLVLGTLPTGTLTTDTLSSNVIDNIEKLEIRLQWSSSLFRQAYLFYVLKTGFHYVTLVRYWGLYFTLAVISKLELFQKWNFLYPGMTSPCPFKMSDECSVRSEINLSKLLFLGRRIIELSMTSKVKYLLSIRASSSLNTSISSLCFQLSIHEGLGNIILMNTLNHSYKTPSFHPITIEIRFLGQKPTNLRDQRLVSVLIYLKHVPKICALNFETRPCFRFFPFRQHFRALTE